MIKRRRQSPDDPSDFVQAVNHGELEFILKPDGHIESVRREAPSTEEIGHDQQLDQQERTQEEQEQVARNRAEIARLKATRIGAVNDLYDALGPWRYVLPTLCIAGTALSAVTRVLAPFAWLLPGVLIALPMGLMAVQLERRARSPEAQKLRAALRAQRPRRSPRWVLEGIRGAFDRINVDDTELEDALEPLYEHGNKMDNGFYPRRL